MDGLCEQNPIGMEGTIGRTMNKSIEKGGCKDDNKELSRINERPHLFWRGR